MLGNIWAKHGAKKRKKRDLDEMQILSVLSIGSVAFLPRQKVVVPKLRTEAFTTEKCLRMPE